MTAVAQAGERLTAPGRPVRVPSLAKAGLDLSTDLSTGYPHWSEVGGRSIPRPDEIGGQAACGKWPGTVLWVLPEGAEHDDARSGSNPGSGRDRDTEWSQGHHGARSSDGR